MPSRLATMAAVFGIITSGVQVATITRSMSAGDSPLPASALPAAATAMSATVSSGPAIRLLSMPTLERIHSSLVSTDAARSSFVTTLAGWYPPNASTRAPAAPWWVRIPDCLFLVRCVAFGSGVVIVSGRGGAVGGSVLTVSFPQCFSLVLSASRWSSVLLAGRSEPDQRLAWADRVALLDQPFDERGGEVSADRVGIDARLKVAKHRAGGQDRGVATLAGLMPSRAEGASGRRDDQAPVRRAAVAVAIGMVRERCPGRVA